MAAGGDPHGNPLQRAGKLGWMNFGHRGGSPRELAPARGKLGWMKFDHRRWSPREPAPARGKIGWMNFRARRGSPRELARRDGKIGPRDRMATVERYPWLWPLSPRPPTCTIRISDSTGTDHGPAR